MTFDSTYLAFMGDLLGVWLQQLAHWLGSQPMFLLFSLTVLIYICKVVRILIGR